jgi:arylsulfatase A-like enzyme
MRNIAKNVIPAIFIASSIIAAVSCDNTEERPPNIILILADDLGYGDVGCYGATKVQTPNIDKLAREGRRFTDAHAASAVCSPSRYGLLTGTYPVRRNFWGPIPHYTQLTIDTSQATLASLLKSSGYATACIGKWHLGFGTDSTDWNTELRPGPLEVGFDYYYGIPQVNSGPPFVYVENHHVVGYDPDDPFVWGERSVTEEWPAKGWQYPLGGARKAHMLYRDREIGTTLKDKAIEWMKQVRQADEKKPFFLYLATTNIHHPFTPAPVFNGTSQCGRYGDFIHELDWIVGEVMRALDAMNISDNSLVILTSDNGGMLNQGGQDAWEAGHRLNGDLLGFKFGAWEGGHRIPFIARWPVKIPAGTRSDQLLSHVDLLATFSAIAGKPLDENGVYDGYDLLPALTGDPPSMIRDQLVISPNSPDHLVIRKDQWVYIPAQDEGGFTEKNKGDHTLGGAAALAFTGQVNSDVVDGKIREDAPPSQLYDLTADPYQTTNLHDQKPEVVTELEDILRSWRRRTGAKPELGWIANRQN